MLPALLGVAFFLAFMLASLSLWTWAGARVAKGEPILARDPHRLAVWGFVDLLVTVIGLIVLQIVAGQVLHRAGMLADGAERSLDDYFLALMASAVCSVATFILSVLWIALRTKACASDLGFRVDRLGRDVVLGVAAFVMLAPLVFGVQMVFVLIMGPTQHPLILMLQKTPDLRLFFAAGLNAVLVAPVVEEYFFRALWQGWTESLRWPVSLEEALLGRREGMPAVAEPSALVASTPALHSENPSAAALVEALASNPAASQDISPQHVVWWPILLSAALFALAHVRHGPDGIALFVLAIGLGYLYQRTRSLTPSIVVHFLLNATSMVMLGVQLFAQ